VADRDHINSIEIVPSKEQLQHEHSEQCFHILSISPLPFSSPLGDSGLR
jgi:hypothetical protein